ncbi:hypothetical protein O1D97_12705 [Marinomonas sp. 15G1-11]|uniref:Uncharacterized protein n=1 Tax=Marinomonas phaeophyticola TaxID=3004091 RepID=A0ABT4JW24_9GAMM|nr:hypothetical protein [Marinomonas sp. 15G1-11]MCZ2722445.1 hypothetical protein [Marinomonas sp. 15G1-11]
MNDTKAKYTYNRDELTLENSDWLEAIEYIRCEQGEERSREILRLLQDHLLKKGVALTEATLNTPYRNTIPSYLQPSYPGDLAIEQKIENIIRWNAMAMVLKANDNGSGVGGHITTYQSAATMLEVGFNHWFRNRSDSYGGDILMVQAHSSPGVYARAYLENRLTTQQMENFRRELQTGEACLHTLIHDDYRISGSYRRLLWDFQHRLQFIKLDL